MELEKGTKQSKKEEKIIEGCDEQESSLEKEHEGKNWFPPDNSKNIFVIES